MRNHVTAAENDNTSKNAKTTDEIISAISENNISFYKHNFDTSIVGL